MQACPFPFTWFPLAWGISLPEHSPSSGQGHVAKADWPGCLLPFMKLGISINETQHCFISQHVCLASCSLCVDGETRALSGCSSSPWVCSRCGPAPAFVLRRQEPTCREPAVNCKWCCQTSDSKHGVEGARTGSSRGC